MENARSPECENADISDRDNHCCDTSTKPLLTEEKMRRKLQFFFMNPIEKWQAKKRFPYKFVVQVFKIILVTLQLCFFAYYRYNYVNYTWDNRITFSHLFLKGWDATREVNAYPPAAGPLAIYKVDEFYSTINYAYEGYSNLGKAIGPYSYANEDNIEGDMLLCLEQYKEGIIFGFNESYIFNSEIEHKCINISGPVNESLDSKVYLEKENININFSALVKAQLMFPIKTVNFKAADHDGQMTLSLDAMPIHLTCKGDVSYKIDNEIESILGSILNYLVIFICVTSFVLCSRAVWRAHQLKNITNMFFVKMYDQPLSHKDRMKFINFWYIMIIINDLLIIVGSAIKEQIEKESFTTDQWNICSLFLGIGNLLVWFGVLRYLGFFRTYNVVILTLQKAAPQVARFLLCALLIYAGFTFSGWLILGPYHIKFRDLSTTSECLFSLINGDDMFATFSIMSFKSPLLWWFSRLYLYSFISLYIYIILSLFISVIMDAYDTIKTYYNDGFPKSSLECFIGDANLEDVSSGLFRSDSTDSLGGLMKDLCCCKKLQQSYSTLTSTAHSRTSILI